MDNILYNVQRQGKISFYVSPLEKLILQYRLTTVTDDLCESAQKLCEPLLKAIFSMGRKQALLDPQQPWKQMTSEQCNIS